jgi:activating signal cointegrator 1
MKVITLWQPWASFIALGWKTIETRTHDRFRNLEGETIGIHAGNTWDKDWKELAVPYLTEEQIIHTKISLKGLFDGGYNKGKILCTTHVSDTNWLNEPASWNALINCNPEEIGFQRFGLFLGNVKSIKPIPAKGKQGIWNYDGEIKYL